MYPDDLVGGRPTPLKNMKVSWDDDIPNLWKQKMFQTTNQITSTPRKMAVPAGSSTWLGDVVQCLLQQKTKLSNLKHDFLEVVQYQIQYQP